MDIMIVAIMFVVGYIRIKIQPKTTTVSVNAQTKQVRKDVPIGNNLLLNKETGAFMKIVEELNLK